jgi:NodT family efflux transporter outer membrane factor (OMF) lipoprotein
MKKIATTVLCALMLVSTSAFAGGPKYKKPEVVTPPNWKAPAPWRDAAPQDSLPKGKWWEIFGDAELNRYEEQALAANQSLVSATARLAEARASARVTRSGLYPELDVNPSAQRYRLSGNRAAVSSVAPTAPITQTVFAIPFTLNYEVDLFGAVRNNLASANASLQANAANLENVRLLVTSELAADYFQLREIDTEMDVLRKAIDYQQKGLDLVNNRHSGGVASGLDVAQQQTVLDSSTTQLHLLTQQRAQYEHAIAVLQGLAASQFNAPVRLLQGQAPAVPLTLPSDLLERRPDVAQAERQVASTFAQIGVARAAFYPSIGLGLGGGLQSTKIGSLFDGPSAIWSIAASALQPLFTGGRNRARLDFAKANYDDSVASYRETVLVSFQQVEDALAGLNALNQASESQQRAVADAERALNLATVRYTGGLVTYLDVITAQETLLTNQRLLAQLTGQQMVTSVYLVKALGGGWDAAAINNQVVKPDLKSIVQQ